MIDNLVRARVREAAVSHRQEQTDYGPGQPQAEAVVAAFEAGAIWADENFEDRRRIGQRQLDDASALMRETVELLRGYEAHHREQAEEADRYGPTPDGEVGREKAERNALMAARLEAWLRGDTQYPTTSADIVPMRRGKTEPSNVREISDPDVFNSLHQIAGLAAPAGRRPPSPMQATLLNDTIGVRVEKRSGDYDFDGEIRAVVIKRSGDIRYVVEDDRGLLLIMNARMCGVPETAPLVAAWRQGGVADLGAFRLTTGDPRFDPARPVCVNGFRFEPTKEDCDV